MGYPASDRMAETPSDGLVNQLYNSGLRQRFSAQLHERVDGRAIERVHRAVASSASSIAVRRLAQFAADRVEGADLDASLQVSMPGRYRIEKAAGSGGAAEQVICDGEFLWRIIGDRYHRTSAAPPAAGIAQIIDPAWMLDQHGLEVAEVVTFDGRPGLRLSAEPLDAVVQQGRGPLSRITVPADRIDAVIDIQLGMALRLEWFYDGESLLVAELSGVTDQVDHAMLRVEPPPGAQVITAANPLAEISLKDAAESALKIAAQVGKWIRKPQR